MKILLLSGGIDSSAIAYWHRPDLSVTVDYNQPAFEGEFRAAKTLCRHLGLKHEVIRLPVYAEGAQAGGYWPFRNQFLITAIAARFGHCHGLKIQIGILKDDIYPDCSTKFIERMEEILHIQGQTASIEAPAANLSCLELLKASGFPPKDLGAAFSCHVSDLPCGQCKGCRKQHDTVTRLSCATSP